MYIKITTVTVLDVSEEGYESLRSLEKSAIISKLDVSGAGTVTIDQISDVDHEANTEGTMKVDDEWDDEFCEVEEDEPSDAPEDDDV